MQETFSRLIRFHRQQTERREMIDAWNSSIERIRGRFAKTIGPKSTKSDAEEKERTEISRGEGGMLKIRFTMTEWRGEEARGEDRRTGRG